MKTFLVTLPVIGEPLQLLGYTSAGRVVGCTVLVGCASSLDIPLPSGVRPSMVQRCLVNCLAPGASLCRRMPTEPEVFLKILGACALRPCAQTHLKKPCAILIRLVGRKTNTSHAAVVFCCSIGI